jgi:hypothetical protein
VNFPATNGQTANSCGCATGTINCSGTCRTDNNYTTNDGNCTGTCTNLAYVQLRNACGTVINSTYSTYSNSGCYASDYTTNDGSCTGSCNYAYVRLRDGCTGAVKDSYYSTYYTSGCTVADYTRNDGACTGACNTAYVRLYNGCTGAVKNAQYSTYTNSSCTSGCCTPGASGQPATSCGCASGLTDCSGTCRASCTPTQSSTCNTYAGSLPCSFPDCYIDGRAWCLLICTNSGAATWRVSADQPGGRWVCFCCN